MSKGSLISFEGLDGAGKTTQIERLVHWLQAHRVPYLRTREPGGTSLGIEIRRLLLNSPQLAITPFAEAFLFQADRAQHFTTVILPALDAGTLVVTDRCLDASIAYQGFARGIGVDLVTQLSLLATQQRVPDLTILLDLDPAHVHSRTSASQSHNSSRQEQNHFDTEEEAFHRRVREGFHLLARAHSDRIKIIDASCSTEQIHEQIVALVRPLL